MRLRIDEIGVVLDDTIQKGLARFGAPKRRKVLDYAEEIKKGLSFNPMNPVEVTDPAASQYYAPYMMAPEGGVYPHPIEHWMEMDGNRDPREYRTVHEFYQQAGVPQTSLDKIREIHNQLQKFSFVRRSLNEIFEVELAESISKAEVMAGAMVPVGTVHTYKNGAKYQKVENGNWRPLKGDKDSGKNGRKHFEQVGHEAVEEHAKVTHLKELVQRKRDQDTMLEEHIANKVKEHVSKLADDKKKVSAKQKKSSGVKKKEALRITPKQTGQNKSTSEKSNNDKKARGWKRKKSGEK